MGDESNDLDEVGSFHFFEVLELAGLERDIYAVRIMVYEGFSRL